MTSLPAALRLPLVRVGGRFMIGQEMAAQAEARDLPRGALYFRGRVAGIGDDGPVDADTAARILRIFPTGMVRHVWQVTAGLSDEVAAAAYLRAAESWAATHWGTVADELADLPSLVEPVIENADLSTQDADLIAAHGRALPWPARSGTLGAVWALTLLRELRGARHFAALDAHGLDTRAALLADPVGAARLQAHGWRPEQLAELQQVADAIPDLPERWAAVEQATDDAFARDLQVLSADRRDRLGALALLAEETAAAAAT